MEGVERATSAAKACPGGIWTAHVAPNSRMRRIASYHCTGRATAWARSSRTAESARTRRPPGYWSGRPPAGVGAEGRPSVRPSARQWVSAAGSGRQPLRRGAPIDGRRLGTRCGRTRRGCGTRSLPVSGCRLPAPRGHPGRSSTSNVSKPRAVDYLALVSSLIRSLFLSQPSEGRLTVITQRRVSPRLCRYRWRPLALPAS